MVLPRLCIGLTLFILASCPWMTTSALPISLGDELVNMGLSFTGSNSSQNGGIVPPDTMGAVGPSSFVELLNGRYAVYDKGSGALLQSSTLDQFWSSAGANPKGSTFDPRVVFDPFSARYFASSADDASPSRNLLLAVSNTSDPTQGWTGFSIKSDPTGQRKADFPTLGFNSQGVYVSATMQPPASGSPQISNLLVVPKADLLAAVPTTVNATLFSNTGTGFARYRSR